jgi:transposase-like protein
MRCPFCASERVERVAQWGGQIITAQWRCDACNSYFEAVREDFDEPAERRPLRREQVADGADQRVTEQRLGAERVDPRA